MGFVVAARLWRTQAYMIVRRGQRTLAPTQRPTQRPDGLWDSEDSDGVAVGGDEGWGDGGEGGGEDSEGGYGDAEG